MSIDGEICAYVRGCKKKNLAIDMAVTLFGITKEQVITALQSYGLIDENGKYIEPVRLTGKEVTMGKKGQSINYPAFQWSQKRQKILRDEYQSGTPIPEIAEKLGTDESTVYKGIDKYDLVRVIQKPAADGNLIPASAEGTPPNDVVPPKVYIDQPLPSIHTPLKDLLHFVIDSANHNNDAMALFIECKDSQACFELGQQSAKLSEAEKIIKTLLNLFPEP